MALNGHQASVKKSARLSQGGQPPSWLEKHGNREWQAWRDANPSHQLTYDAWKQSGPHVNGLGLYYMTLDILDEEDSSNEASQVKGTKPQPGKESGKPIGRPKKPSTTNGNGPPRSTDSATPSAVADLEDLSPSAKKKRKARKKPVSEEFIASASDSGEVAKDAQNSTSRAGIATPSAPIITVNGKRKSSIRKVKTKKKLSEETVSPEDELDDPMDTSIDDIATRAAASPLPVRPAPKPATTGQISEAPKKSHILKLSTRKMPKKKDASDDAAPEVVDDASAPAQATPTTVTSVTAPNMTVNTNTKTSTAGSVDQDADSAAASPDPTSAAGSSARRGLRARKPAQQRPYYHDAQLFEDSSPTTGSALDPASPAPFAQSRRVSLASSLSRNVDDALLAQLDQEALALLQEEETSPSASAKGPKHFKGKGRAWKKEGSDEDEEFSLAAKKKAAKAARMKGVVPKKRGRPRKSGRSEEIIGESEEEGRRKRGARKIGLSESVVEDSEEGEKFGLLKSRDGTVENSELGSADEVVSPVRK